MRIEASNILEDSWIKPRNIRFEIQKLVKISKTWLTLQKKQPDMFS